MTSRHNGGAVYDIGRYDGSLFLPLFIELEKPSFKMPTESSYPKLDIPPVDIWTAIFERKDRKYPDDKGRRA